MSITMLGEGKAPPEILAALRQIDPNADLVHLGGTRWWLGVRAPNPAAQKRLESLGRRRESSPIIRDPAERAYVDETLGREWMMLRVMADGFRPVQLYDVDGSPGHDIVEDFRIRDWNLRHKTEEQAKRELRDEVSLDRANAEHVRRWAARAKEAAMEAYRFIFRGKRSVTVDRQLE